MVSFLGAVGVQPEGEKRKGACKKGKTTTKLQKDGEVRVVYFKRPLSIVGGV